MTRFDVMKHLKVLEAANLIVSKRSGREKLYFLNFVSSKSVRGSVAVIIDTRGQMRRNNPRSEGDFDNADEYWEPTREIHAFGATKLLEIVLRFRQGGLSPSSQQ